MPDPLVTADGDRLWDGVLPQLYMDKVPNRDALAKLLDKLAGLGAQGVAFHASSVALEPKFEAYAALGKARGLRTLAAFGMDSDDIPGKTQRIGAVAANPACDGVILDAEGHWEDEASDRAKAQELCAGLHDKAPGSLWIDQPWWKPSVHWSRFPWEEFGRLVQVRAPQAYVNDYIQDYGAARYRIVWAKYEQEWAALEQNRLAPAGIHDRRIPTIQGYAWVLSDLVDCLLRNPCVILWCEPGPDDSTCLGWRVVRGLAARGFVGPGAVQAFKTAAHLPADAVVDRRVLQALGLVS